MFLKTPAMASGFFPTSANVSPVSIEGPGRQGPWGNVGCGINKPRKYPEGEECRYVVGSPEQCLTILFCVRSTGRPEPGHAEASVTTG